MKTDLHDQDNVVIHNERSLRTLLRALALGQGEFSLILVRCNYRTLQERVLQQLQEQSFVQFRELVLPVSARTLHTTLVAELGDEPPPALMVLGLESVIALEDLLISINQARDKFRQHFSFPLVLWVTDNVLRKLVRLAPDFSNWTLPIQFASTTDELIELLQHQADFLFAKIFDTAGEPFLENSTLNFSGGMVNRLELESAMSELQSRGCHFPNLEASIQFILGRDAFSNNQMERSRQLYEQSLAYWQQNHYLERMGCVLHSLGLWWLTYAEMHRAQYEQACSRAKEYFQQCVAVFEQAQRPDLVAKFINALGGILQRWQQWDELEIVAQKALALHQTYPHPFRLARVHGFLAQVHLAKSAWTKAKQAAETALAILASTQSPASDAVSSEQSANLDPVRSYHQGWYLFSLARAHSSLGQAQEAIATLETAATETKPYYDPELYIRILEELRSLYFKQGDYLKAFHIKQDQRSIEKQYGFRAFVGAGRLQPKQQVANPALPGIATQGTVAQEIA